MSIRKWIALYSAYKKRFDTELILKIENKTYVQIEEETRKENELDYSVIPL